MTATISVVVITYNRPAFLREAVSSVAAQTRPPHEIIVVDDGSTAPVADALVGFEDRVTLIAQANAGQQAARNRGAAAASGDWIAFLDDDDKWDADYVATVEAAVAAMNVEALFCNFRRFSADGVEPDGFFDRAPAQFWTGLDRGGDFVDAGRWPIMRHTAFSMFYPSMMVVRRDLYERLGGFDRRLRGVRCEDQEFMVRVSEAARIGLVTRPVASYRMHDGNDAGSPARNAIGLLHIWTLIRREHDLDAATQAEVDAYLRRQTARAFDAAFQLHEFATLRSLAPWLHRDDRTAVRRAKAACARLPDGMARRAAAALEGAGDRLRGRPSSAP